MTTINLHFSPGGALLTDDALILSAARMPVYPVCGFSEPDTVQAHRRVRSLLYPQTGFSSAFRSRTALANPSPPVLPAHATPRLLP